MRLGSLMAFWDQPRFRVDLFCRITRMGRVFFFLFAIWNGYIMKRKWRIWRTDEFLHAYY